MLSVYMPPEDNADALIKYMQTDPSWTNLGNNDVEASKMAGQHYLVIAGWTNPYGHGHVVVIVPGRVNGYRKAF